MEKLEINDSSTLTHHLKKLKGLVDRLEDGKYVLTDLGHVAHTILRRGDFYAKVHHSEAQKELRELSLRNPLVTFPLIVGATMFLPLTWFAMFVGRIGYTVAGCYLVYWGLKHILPEFGFSRQLAIYITFIIFGLVWLFSLI
jgi:hypothetical protein